MAIKNRLLKKLNLAKQNISNLISTKDTTDFDNAYANFAEAKTLCANALTKDNYAKYNEVYEGIALAFQNLSQIGFNEEALTLCNDLLQYIITQTENETQFKKEIFFLPVQAAMWDSLESVWKEAYSDKAHTITYVMPLPYANLNKDGSVSKWCLEKDEYPSYVPTIHYNDVDLKEMHPDVIVINNPYDDLNYITRVDEKYFSKNLKKYTDKLVYIPYFVLSESCNETDLKHFVTTGGVVYSDLVIVQSETLKQLYIDILSNKDTWQDKRYWKDKTYWENRILGLGSPKIDKAVNLKKEDFDLPDEWKKIIKGKKVVLYLTGLYPQVFNADKIFNKMRYVFDIFKKRNDVVLWWRPHPLIKESLHALLPIVEEEYLKLENEYIRQGFGIYDDTGDLHRAICYSDAYYGDDSSVVTLYKHTGKPVMIENFDVL